MRRITLTDEELKELRRFLNVVISGCIDGSIIAPFEDLRKKEIKQANKYKKLYNKIFDVDKVIEPIDTEE